MFAKISRTLSVSALAFAFVGAGFLGSASAAVSIGATPLKVVLEAQPGETKTFEIKAINRNDAEMKYKIELKDAKASDELGNASFQDAKPEDKMAVPNWIKLPSSEVSVPKNDMSPVKFELTVPKDAAPGGHYGMVIFSPAEKGPDAGNVGVVGQVGVPLLIKVAGDIKEIASVESFGLSDGKNQESDNINFQIKIKNEGNVHVLPAGKVFLKSNGKPLTKIAKIKNMDGSEEIVDYLPINEGKGYTLPGSNRVYEASWTMNKQYADITASYEISFGKEKVQMLSGEQKFSISKNASIESFTYNAEKQEFVAKIKNTGSISLPLRAQIGVFSDAGGDAKITISAPKDGKVEILKAGESKELVFPWNGLSVLAPSKDNKFHAVINYVIDAGEGKSATASVHLPFGEKNETSMYASFFTAENALPLGLILILAVATGIYFMRRKTH